MQKLTDEQLLDFILDKNDDDGVPFYEWKEAKTELLSRLSQGRKAIEAMKAKIEEQTPAQSTVLRIPTMDEIKKVMEALP